MGIRQQEGFTIIETSLFLAVSGLLVVGLVVGAGASLSVQRYRDATQSFKSLIQAQYSDLANIQNARANNLKCTAAAKVVTGTGTTAGQSSCYLVGKYVRINRSAITINTVLASQKSTALRTSDIDTLRLNYTLRASTTEVKQDVMDWGTEIAWPGTGSGSRSPTTPRTISFLFIRSPDSGLIYTFSSNDLPAEDKVSDLLVVGNHIPGQGGRTICIGSGGLLTGGDGVMALAINPYAGSASAVELRSNDYMSSTPGASQC